MFKVFIRHFLVCFTCITGFIIGALALAPVAHAAGGSITLTMPNNAALLGHVGTQIQIAGAGLTPATTYNLYTTTSNDAAACSAQNAAQMASFTTNPTITTDTAGAFQLTTKWPDNAANATTPYYVCAVPSNGSPTPAGTLSTQPFTVAQPVTLAASPQTVQPGGTITVSGTGWVPPQDISVSIIGNNGTVTNQTVQGNQVTPTQGSFSVQIALPASIGPGSYTVKAFAVNEQTTTMTATLPNAFTVAQQQATVTPTQQATNTPTQQATPNPTNHTTNNGGGGGGMNILIFGLGGLGAVLVIIGITMYVVYSRKGQPGY